MQAIQINHAAWAEVHLDRLEHNLKWVRNQIPDGTKIMAVLKSNAYGHGAYRVAEHILKHGVDQIAVANVDEAIELRKVGIRAPILILGVTVPEQASYITKYELTAMVCNYPSAEALSNEAKLNKKKIKVHVRIDLGLGSFGLNAAETITFVRKLLTLEGIEIEGIFTHLPSIYDDNREQVMNNLAIFNDVIDQIHNLGLDIPLIHAGSSPAILKYPQAFYNMVRPGIIFYGLKVFKDEPVTYLLPVMELKARIVHMKEIEAGKSLGYGSTLITNKVTRIATIPIGYGDGLFFYHIKNAQVLINGKRFPIVGRVCMDHFMVDVTSDASIRIDDEVVIFGKQGQEFISIEELAYKANIEVECGDCISMLGLRVPRVYVN